MRNVTSFLRGLYFINMLLLALVLISLTGCQSIQTAAGNGNIKEVQHQLSLGANVNRRNFFSRDTALIESARHGHMDVVELLLKNGADVNLQGEAWYTPLHVAAWEGHAKIVKVLLENSADVNKFQGHDKALNGVARRGHIEVAKILLSHGADINALGGNKCTALLEAVSNNQLEMVEFLLIHGASVNARADYGCTPLYQAYRENNIEIAKMLLEHGADPKLECHGWKIPEDFLMKIRK